MPRYEPTPPADSPIVVYPPTQQPQEPADIKYAGRRAGKAAARSWAISGKGSKTPYEPQKWGSSYAGLARDMQIPSFWRDLLTEQEAEQRELEALESPQLRGKDQGDPNDLGSLNEVAAAKERLATVRRRAEAEWRDISGSATPDLLRPSAPGFLIQTWGRAAVAAGVLLDVFERRPLTPGMVDTVAGIPTVKIPRLVSGATTTVQTAENAAVNEIDAVSTSYSAPVAMIAGQQDMSRQLLDFSQPGIDEVLTDQLGRDFGSKFDSQLINGSATAGQTRGILNAASILSVTGSVTTASAFLGSLQQAYSQLAGASGFGNANADEYVTILAPRRLAWLQANTTYPVDQLVPGTLVPSPGVPLNLGASTNEDVALVVERSNVLVLGGTPQLRIFEQAGSATQTVRLSAYGAVAVLVRNPVGIAKVTGLTAPAGF